MVTVSDQAKPASKDQVKTGYLGYGPDHRSSLPSVPFTFSMDALHHPADSTYVVRASATRPGPFPNCSQPEPDLDVLARTTVNPWDEPRFAQAVTALGRHKLIVAGISTEVCLGLTAIRAVGLGYDACAAVDASGTFSLTKRETGLLRLAQAGVIVTDYATTMVEPRRAPV